MYMLLAPPLVHSFVHIHPYSGADMDELEENQTYKGFLVKIRFDQRGTLSMTHILETSGKYLR